MANKAPVSICFSERARIADEYGELARRKEEAEVRLAKELGCNADRLKELERIIVGWFESSEPHAAEVVEGKLFLVEVKPREFQREITPAMKKAFFKAVKSKLKDPLEAFDV